MPIFRDEVLIADPTLVSATPAPPAGDPAAPDPPVQQPAPAEAEAEAEAAPEEAEVVGDPPPPPEPAESRAERQKKEALSPQHLATHFPKNPFCEWCQRGRMTSARVQRKPADPDVEPVKPPPTKHGQEISTDTYIVAKSADDKTKTAHGGECCVQTVPTQPEPSSMGGA